MLSTRKCQPREERKVAAFITEHLSAFPAKIMYELTEIANIYYRKKEGVWLVIR